MPYRFVANPGYAEVQLFGLIDRFEPLPPEEWSVVLLTKRLLYNYDDVEKFGIDPWHLIESTKRLAALGIVFAACAPQPSLFGINRQMAQLSGTEGELVRVFKDRASAVAWLLHGSETPE